ncbi:MAG TPA: glycosyltransferase, partial [Dissulfurispiraceae bacterium]
FCSFEVGGFPYRIAEILNRHGIEAYYISLARDASGHNSTRFHFGETNAPWDLSGGFARRGVKLLKEIKTRYHVTHCFATGGKSYLLKQAGIDYRYWSYGSDLDQVCFSGFWPSNYPVWKRFLVYPYFWARLRPEARESIRQAESVMIAPYQLELLHAVAPGKSMFFLPHFIKTGDYRSLVRKKEESRKIICDRIGAKRFLFSSVRHFWAGRHGAAADYKGNEIALRGFDAYLHGSKAYDTKLVLVAKGPDVEESKTLARELGIDENVMWVGEMRRDELEQYYQGASVCLGQFGTPVLTFAALEPLAYATACVSYFADGGTAVPFYRRLPPIKNTNKPEEIAGLIQGILQTGSSETGRESHEWLREHCSEERFVSAFVEVFEGKGK